MKNHCKECKTNPRKGGQWCLKCHAAYLRRWRKSHPLTTEQRKRMNARCYAHVYRKRGKIPIKPCAACGEAKAEMHHSDYSKPVAVIWLCRPCHLLLHRRARLEAVKSQWAQDVATFLQKEQF